MVFETNSDNQESTVPQTTLSGTRDHSSIRGTEDKLMIDPVRGAYFFCPQLSCTHVPWFTHPSDTDMTKSFSHLSLMHSLLHPRVSSWHYLFKVQRALVLQNISSHQWENCLGFLDYRYAAVWFCWVTYFTDICSRATISPTEDWDWLVPFPSYHHPLLWYWLAPSVLASLAPWTLPSPIPFVETDVSEDR